MFDVDVARFRFTESHGNQFLLVRDDAEIVVLTLHALLIFLSEPVLKTVTVFVAQLVIELVVVHIPFARVIDM